MTEPGSAAEQPPRAAAVGLGLVRYADGSPGCAWAGIDLEYQRYHDQEWGVPVADDRRLFEKLCLEGFQAGLSWITILRKRPAFRVAFADFDRDVVASFDDGDIERLVQDAGIIRHRGKIEAAINNAQRAIEIADRYKSLAAFIWQFEPTVDARPDVLDAPTVASLTTTVESSALSKALKREGFRFVGPTTAYAFMQSMGLVNDHVVGCHRRSEIERLRWDFSRP